MRATEHAQPNYYITAGASVSIKSSLFIRPTAQPIRIPHKCDVKLKKKTQIEFKL